MHAFGALQALPAQHGWLVAPQAAHVGPVHTLPALHMLPAQQGEPTTPQTPASASGAPSGGASFVAPSTTSEVD
jgi:hypothetical protein